MRIKKKSRMKKKKENATNISFFCVTLKKKCSSLVGGSGRRCGRSRPATIAAAAVTADARRSRFNDSIVNADSGGSLTVINNGRRDLDC